METLSIIYLISVAISLAIMIFVIFHEEEITVKDLLTMLLVLAIPIVNIIIYGFAFIKVDIEKDGPVSKAVKILDKLLKIKIKK